MLHALLSCACRCGLQHEAPSCCSLGFSLQPPRTHTTPAVQPHRYMADEHFWHVYFTLARKHLPDAAFSWAPGEPLPFAGGHAGLGLGAG